jgi:hypothetical protein
VGLLTLAGLDPTAFGNSHRQQPEQEDVPTTQLLFVSREGTCFEPGKEGHNSINESALGLGRVKTVPSEVGPESQ